jgi:hypothetical protein
MTIQSVAIKLLRPTQIAVGQKLVRLKRKGLRGLEGKPQELIDFILVHPIKVVLGPDGLVYVIDHHHLALALLKEGFKTSPVEVAADYSTLSVADFWAKMTAQQWVHPFDGKGIERPITAIPTRLEALQDDPYRSLATLVRYAGGYVKTETPFVEFRWADYFRPLVKAKLLTGDFKAGVAKAQALAHLPAAAKLPGYLNEKLSKPKETPATETAKVASAKPKRPLRS